jgi:dCTP deaminase
MFLSDHQIKRRAQEGMIEPFNNGQVNLKPQTPNGPFGSVQKSISWGLSSYGYDVRLDNSFLVPKFDQHASLCIDPKNSSTKDYDHVVSDIIFIPPHSFILGQTIEHLRIPRDILALCIGKSTYARCGIIVNVTPLEPEWEGTITIEISNTNVKPAKIYAGEGIAQLLFMWCDPQGLRAMQRAEMNRNPNFIAECTNFDNLCETSYADRKGKYIGQKEVTLPK